MIFNPAKTYGDIFKTKMTRFDTKKPKMAQPSLVVISVVLCLSLANSPTVVLADEDTIDTITTTEFGKKYNYLLSNFDCRKNLQ